MADNYRLIHAKDSVYSLNSYQAINGLQRVNYRYTGREQDIDEIGNALHVDTVTEPETSGSFEVTDTGSLASLFARMRFQNATQDYMAGSGGDVATNDFDINEDDLQYMLFDFVEMKRPGGTFTEAKLIPNAFLTRFNIRLNSDNVGSVNFDWMGNLIVPAYKPYHKLQSFPLEFVTVTEAELNAGWTGVTSATYGILGGMVNNIQLGPTDLEWNGVTDTQIDLTASGIAKVGDLDADDRIMAWLFANTPGDLLAIDYIHDTRFVKPDRIDIWLEPDDEVLADGNRMLRIQSFDLSADIPRDDLKEIHRNESRTSTFYKHARYPLNFTGTINVLETTLHKWATLQGKTLNEAATSDPVDTDNVLDVTSWVDAQIQVAWYKYGSSDPIQEMTLGKVKITGYEGSMNVGGRKEAVWSYKTDGDFALSGHDVA